VGRYDLGSADAFSLAESFYVFMAATIYAAALLEVDPFGQPGVEAGKHHTRDILAADR
jgi:glucose-6-phosphate isomerase